ncbi:MAG TPA: SCO family protein [Streptosporangiaceae bacterium]|nr:SCO family protein [Streptosporangiaceae bacterium]
MNSGLNINDPTVVAAFKTALLHQGLAAALLFIVLSLAWVSVREFRGARPGDPAQDTRQPEAPARRVLRVGFGLLWILDGILQAQPGMAVGLPSEVIKPTAQSSPSWVQHLVNWAGTSWSYHPIQAAAAAVWIQIGIGIWLLLASRGRLSQYAALVSVGWGLVVWAFGESFGGIFAPGLSWLTGAPGAAVCYAVAGVLLALPAGIWRSSRTGALMTRCFGVFLVGMAVLQAWPGRAFWQGEVHGQPGSLTSMVQSMSVLSQPSALADLTSAFGSFVRSDGFAVNLIAVLVLAVTGAAFAYRNPRVVRIGLIVLTVFGLANWVLVQDMGFFGGLGTDPNSMIPMLLLATASYLALTPLPAADAQDASESAAKPAQEAQTAEIPALPEAVAPRSNWRERLKPANLSGTVATASLASVASAGAIGVILLGAVPMAAAQASDAAAPILAQSVDGSSALMNSPAPGFTLTDQDGRTVSLASLHGKAILLTFLDPVCVTDCPLIAQEFRQAGLLLAGHASQVELVAVNINPLYSDVSYLRAFDQQERLTSLPNWLYLTGAPAQLRPIWKKYGIASETLPAGSMLGHSDAAFVIGTNGRLRQELDFDPGPGTAATVSSFATELANAAEQALKQP